MTSISFSKRETDDRDISADHHISFTIIPQSEDVEGELVTLGFPIDDARTIASWEMTSTSTKIVDDQDAPANRGLSLAIAPQSADVEGTPSLTVVGVESIDFEIPIDEARTTKKLCIAGLVLSYIVGVVAIIVSHFAENTHSIRQSGDSGLFLPLYFELQQEPKALIVLLVNAVTVIITECLGYIHATALKWALFKENRLEFNSNIRLFTFARKSFPNGIISNILYLFSLAMCYGSTPFFIIEYSFEPDRDPSTILNPCMFSRAGPIFYGCSILFQALLCTYCLLGSWIPTWSSNPINTAAIAISNMQRRRNNGCLSSVPGHVVPVPRRPKEYQGTALKAHSHAAWTFYAVIATFLILVLSAIAVVLLYSFVKDNEHVSGWNDWSLLPSYYSPDRVDYTPSSTSMTTPHFLRPTFLRTKPPMSRGLVYNRPPEIKIPLAILANAFLQLPVTVGLHCAELQVTLTRDENTWRSLANKNGGTIQSSVLNSTLFSSQFLILLIFKPSIHWMYGLIFAVDAINGAYVFIPQIVWLLFTWMPFLGFVTLLSSWRPDGPLPSTYGHIQTMINLVDEWSPHMYWGDKGLRLEEGGRIRHAGTSSQPLPPIDMSAEYM